MNGNTNEFEVQNVQLNYTAPVKMDEAERARCRENRLCFRCRRPGHVSNTCPTFQSAPNRPRPSVDISAKKY